MEEIRQKEIEKEMKLNKKTKEKNNIRDKLNYLIYIIEQEEYIKITRIIDQIKKKMNSPVKVCVKCRKKHDKRFFVEDETVLSGLCKNCYITESNKQALYESIPKRNNLKSVEEDTHYCKTCRHTKLASDFSYKKGTSILRSICNACIDFFKDPEKRKITNGNAYLYFDYIERNKLRGLGFEPLNCWFINSEFHHLLEDENGNQNFNIGIFVPNELHQSVRHNGFNWKNIRKMNRLAYEFLEYQKFKGSCYKTPLRDIA